MSTGGPILVTGTAVRVGDVGGPVVAPRPALTGTRLDPLRGWQRIEASPGTEQVSGSEMG